MGPALGRATLEKLGTDISMSKSCLTYNINGDSAEHTFLRKQRNEGTYTPTHQLRFVQRRRQHRHRVQRCLKNGRLRRR